jgi:hypothetical protein
MAIYNVTKHAVVALSESLHHDLSVQGSTVGVSVLCPAYVPTGISNSERNGRRSSQSGAFRAADGLETKTSGKPCLLASSRPTMSHAPFVAAIKENHFYILTHPRIRARSRRAWRTSCKSARRAIRWRFETDDRFFLHGLASNGSALVGLCRAHTTSFLAHPATQSARRRRIERPPPGRHARLVRRPGAAARRRGRAARDRRGGTASAPTSLSTSPRAYPQRTAGLVLIEPMPPPALTGRLGFLRHFRFIPGVISSLIRALNAIGIYAGASSRWISKRGTRRCAPAPPTSPSTPRPSATCASRRSRDNLRALAAVGDALPEPSRIACPILVLTSKNTNMTDPAKARAELAPLPNAEFVQVRRRALDPHRAARSDVSRDRGVDF